LGGSACENHFVGGDLSVGTPHNKGGTGGAGTRTNGIAGVTIAAFAEREDELLSGLHEKEFRATTMDFTEARVTPDERSSSGSPALVARRSDFDHLNCG
jgi:hypothetical protein